MRVRTAGLASGRGPGVELRDVGQAVRAGWARIVGGVVVGLAVAAAVNWLVTPQYASSARLFVSAASAADASAAYEGDLFSRERVASYAELLTMESLAAEVVDELDLPLTPAEVSDKVTATAVPETVLLDVTVTDTSAERARDIADALVGRFTAQVAELESPDGADGSMIEVATVQPPQVARDPVSPDVPRNLALGGVLGLLGGFALALVRHRLDRTVTTGEHVEAATGSGLMGAVVHDGQLAAQHVVVAGGGSAVSAEAFRGIRAGLRSGDGEAPPRVVVVTSSLPGEGKTTLAVNLAAALGQSGSRVLLVEADLWRPRVTRYLGLDTGSGSGAGLTDVLAGAAELGEVTQPWHDGTVTVLPAGPMPPSPGELLGSARMRTLLETLRSTYDVVVVDGPSLLTVSDAAVLSAMADGCVITTRYGRTRREQLAAAAATLSRVDARVLGVVLNGVPRTAAARRGYGFSHRYEADPDRRRGAAPTAAAPHRRRTSPRTPGTLLPAPSTEGQGAAS